MQSVSSRIWTRVAVSISYDDNHYTTGTSKTKLLYTQPVNINGYVPFLINTSDTIMRMGIFTY